VYTMMSNDKRMIECPYCCSEIDAQAIKCKFCKSEIESFNQVISHNEPNLCPYCGETISVNNSKCTVCEDFVRQKSKDKKVESKDIKTESKDKKAESKDKKAESKLKAKRKAEELATKAAEDHAEAAEITNLIGRGNTSFNIANDGLACEYEGWIYYIDGSDNDSIHKMRIDGSDDVKINKESSDYLNVIGDWIIFRNWNDSQRIHRININGGESKRVHDKGTSMVKVIDEWIYYQGKICFETNEHNNLYRVKLDGTMEQRIGEFKDSFDVYDDRIYYVGYEDEDFKIFCMRPDGSDKQIVYDDKACSLLGIYKGWLYFISAMSDLHRLNLDNGELNKLTIYNDDNEPVSVRKGSVTDSWFYFFDTFADEQLCRVYFDGSGQEVIISEEIESINIAGDWLFYKKQTQYDFENSSFTSDNNIYRFKLDHPVSSDFYEALDKAETDTEGALFAEAAKVVSVSGLRITIPEGYIYSTDADETSGLIIVAIIPSDPGNKVIDENFRMYSVESFFISEVLSLNQDIDIKGNGGSLVATMMNMFPGENELIETKNGLIKYFSEMVPQDENDISIIYHGILVSDKGSFYQLQVQFNYNDGDYALMKQKTIDIIKGIDFIGEEDYFLQSESSDRDINQQVIHRGMIKVKQSAVMPLNEMNKLNLAETLQQSTNEKVINDEQVDENPEQIQKAINALNKLMQDVEKINEHMEKMQNATSGEAAAEGSFNMANKLPCSGLPLSALSDADFETDGRVSLSIAQHINDALTDLNERTPVMECGIANDLFVNLVNIVDFTDYRDNIIETVVGNHAGMTMKGLFLYTIRSFFGSMRKYNQVFAVKDYYYNLFNEMLKYFFSPSEPIADDTMLRAFGAFGVKYKNDLQPLFNTFNLLPDANILGFKLIYIYESTKAVLAGCKEDLAVCSDKINALRLLQYLSDDVIYFKPGQVVFEDSKRVMKGFEANVEYFWNYPEILLDFEAFGEGLGDLINYLEDDITYTYSIAEMDEADRHFFDDEDVTGFTFLNLFASEAADFYPGEEDSYEVYLDLDLELSHREIKDRIAGLISSLASYNNYYIDPKSISITNTKSYSKSITDDYCLTLEELGLSVEDISSQQNNEEIINTNATEASYDYPVAYPPDHICAFYRQQHVSGLATVGFQQLTSGQINIQINRGVELALEAVRTGIFTPPYDNKEFAWEFARVFRVDDSAFKGNYDREAEIQQPYIRSAAFLSALRSFAWTLQGYLEKKNMRHDDVSLKEITSITNFIEQRSLLNYTNDSFFPALCGVADYDSAYIPLSVADPLFAQICRLTKCKTCGDLFTLRSELTTLTSVMEKIKDHLFENRKDKTEQLTGILSDILYAWCALSLAADGAFQIVDGTLSYYLETEKGGVENFSLPYWEDDEDEKSALVQLMEEISRLPKADFEGTYFEAELVGTGYEGRASNIENMNVGEQVELKRNPNNPHDSNAIEVLNILDQSLGHIPKDYAAVLAPALDQGLVYIESAEVLSVTPLSQRGQRAKSPLISVAVKLTYYDSSIIEDKDDAGARLLIAAKEGFVDEVATLVGQVSDINIRDEEGNTALNLASGYGHTDIVNILLENGADIHVRCKNGTKAFQYAIANYCYDIAEALMHKGADINEQDDKYGYTALMWEASQIADIDMVEFLLKKGADVNIQAIDGRTALSLAASDGHLEIVKMLLEYGAEVNFRDKYNDTALTIAMENGHDEIVNLLKQQGAKE
jgi:ankyrin repeat protein